MKFFDASTINQFRFRPPKVLRLKKLGLNNKYWTEFIENHADELPRFDLGKMVKIRADSSIEIKHENKSFEFGENVNRKNYFPDVQMVLHDGLIQKIFGWAEKEPIVVGSLDLSILGKFYLAQKKKYGKFSDIITRVGMQ